jgi:hypothetical protein
MHSSFFKFTLALNSDLLFWKLLFFAFLLGISETFVCSVSALRVKIALLLDVCHLLLLFSGTLTYVEIIYFS